MLWGVHTGEALACEGCGAASGRGRGSTFQGIISDLPGVAAQLCAFIATLFDRVWFRLIRSRWHLGCCDSRVATGSRLWTRVVCMGIRNWMGRFGCHAAVSGLGEGNSLCAPRRHFWALHLSEGRGGRNPMCRVPRFRLYSSLFRLLLRRTVYCTEFHTFNVVPDCSHN